jgi:hypothetical protein
MKITQLSVFIENKPGHIIAPCRLLADAGIDIRALSLPDSQPFGILRMIVSDWEKAAKILQDAGFVVKPTEVLAVEVPDRPGSLHEVLAVLEGTSLNIDYMYAFPFGGEKAILIFGFSDTEAAAARLRSVGVRMVGAEALGKASSAAR